MPARIRAFLLVEAVAFGVAASIHGGLVLSGYEHPEARTAESIIALVLIIGWIATFIQRTWTRRIGVLAQGFAILGTLVGLFTIIVGVGPRTVPDVIYHVAILVLLFWGLNYAVQARRAERAREGHI